MLWTPLFLPLVCNGIVPRGQCVLQLVDCVAGTAVARSIASLRDHAHYVRLGVCATRENTVSIQSSIETPAATKRLRSTATIKWPGRRSVESGTVSCFYE